MLQLHSPIQGFRRSLTALMLLVIGVCGCGKDVGPRDDQAYREMQAGFTCYQAAHGDSLPSNLQALAAFARREGISLPSFKADSDWTEFVYIANVASNDPGAIPLVIDVPERRGKNTGMVGFYGGYARWLPHDQLDQLIEEPWLLALDEFKDAAALEEFKQRVKVIYPASMEGSGLGERIRGNHKGAD